MTTSESDDTGYLIPHLICSPCAAAIDFYKNAFGAQEVGRWPGSDGRLIHATIRIDGRCVFLADGDGGDRPGPANFIVHRYVKDCDAAVERACQAGATLIIAPADAFWGDRYALIRDPFGHQWAFATRVKA